MPAGSFVMGTSSDPWALDNERPAHRVDLPGYYLFHAVRADLLRRLGCTQEAVDAYDAALALTGNERERAFLRRRRDELSPSARSSEA